MILVTGLCVSCCVGGALAARRVRSDARLALLGSRDELADRSSASALLARLGRSRLAVAMGDPARLGRRLSVAGVERDRDIVIGLRALGLCGALALPLSIAMGGAPVALAAAPLLAMCALRGPEVFLARLGRRRQERIAARVPDLVELLVATTRAGLSPSVAFRRSASVLRGPLATEVERAVRGMDLGLPWTVALAEMVDRTDVASLRRLAVALSRSQRLGSSVGSTLRAVSNDLRSDRRVRSEEAARKAPVKMLFPLVFLVLPAFLLLTVGPVVLATVRSLH